MQWDYDVKTFLYFQMRIQKCYSVNSTQEHLYAARIRAIAEGGEFATADTGFSQPTLPFFTATEALQTPVMFTENLNSRGFTLRWIPPKMLPVKPSNTI